MSFFGLSEITNPLNGTLDFGDNDGINISSFTFGPNGDVLSAEAGELFLNGVPVGSGSGNVTNPLTDSLNFNNLQGTNINGLVFTPTGDVLTASDGLLFVNGQPISFPAGEYITNIDSQNSNIGVARAGGDVTLSLNPTLAISQLNANGASLNFAQIYELKILDITNPPGNTPVNQFNLRTEGLILTYQQNANPIQPFPLSFSSDDNNIILNSVNETNLFNASLNPNAILSTVTLKSIELTDEGGSLAVNGNTVAFDSSIPPFTQIQTDSNISSDEIRSNEFYISLNPTISVDSINSLTCATSTINLNDSSADQSITLTLDNGVLNTTLTGGTPQPVPLSITSNSITVTQTANAVNLETIPAVYPLADVLAAGEFPGDANQQSIENLNRLSMTGPLQILAAYPAFDFQMTLPDFIQNTNNNLGLNIVTDVGASFGSAILAFSQQQNGGQNYTFFNSINPPSNSGLTPGYFSLYGNSQIFRAAPTGQMYISNPNREGGGQILDTLTNAPVITGGQGIEVTTNATATSLSYTISQNGQFDSLKFPSDGPLIQQVYNGLEGGNGSPLLLIQATSDQIGFDPVTQIAGRLEIVPQYSAIDAATVLLSYGGSVQPNGDSNFNFPGCFLTSREDSNGVPSLFIDGCAPGGDIADLNIYLGVNSNSLVTTEDINVTGTITNETGPVQITGNLQVTGTVISNNTISQTIGENTERVFSLNNYPGIDSQNPPRGALSGIYMLPTEQENLIAGYVANKGRRFIIINDNENYTFSLLDIPAPSIQGQTFTFLISPESPAVSFRVRVSDNLIYEFLRGETCTFMFSLSNGWNYFGYGH